MHILLHNTAFMRLKYINNPVQKIVFSWFPNALFVQSATQSLPTMYRNSFFFFFFIYSLVVFHIWRSHQYCSRTKAFSSCFGWVRQSFTEEIYCRKCTFYFASEVQRNNRIFFKIDWICTKNRILTETFCKKVTNLASRA